MIDHGTAKACTKCGVTKPLSEFHLCKTGADGLRGDCKDCRRAARVARRARRSEAQIEADRAARREYYEANRGRIVEYNAAYLEAHREAVYAREAAYRAANPHIAWAKNYRRRARDCGSEVVEEKFTKTDVTERYGDACVYCGGEFEELDHYVPISRGGPHTLDNVRPSCAACNNKKNAAGHQMEERRA